MFIARCYDLQNKEMSSGDGTLGVSEQFKLLESLLQKLMHKETLSTPQLTDKKDIKSHLEKMKQYFKVCGVSAPETKITILFNTLSDDMRFELCGALEFKAHENDYAWIEKKLLELFSPKESEITPLVKLYSCKQGSAQPIREFLSEIRIEGYKLLKDIDPEEREQHLIDAFTKGLQSEELRSALSRKEVTTLDEAYRLVKKEKPNADSEYVRKMEMNPDHTHEIEKLQNQMLMIQKQLSYIVTILEKTRQPNEVSYADITRRKKAADQEVGQSSRYVPRQPPAQQSRTTQCWNCGLNGHIARFCRVKQCASCGQFGHVAENCRSKRNARNPRRVRRIWEDKGSEEWETGSPDDHMSDVSSQENDIRGRNEIPEVCALTIHPRNPRKSEVGLTNGEEKMRKKKECKKYPDYIVELEEFIEGRRRKKNTCLTKEKTARMENHTENARNKPLVRGKCGGKQAKLFLDTGAEISVIDEGFIQHLGDRTIRRHRENKTIKCANNSRMDTKGWVRLGVQIGGQLRECKFWVVQKLVPKIIIGIRAMKDMGVAVDPTEECVWINGVRVPFLARVQPQSLFGADSGNVFEPGLRVEGRQGM